MIPDVRLALSDLLDSLAFVKQDSEFIHIIKELQALLIILEKKDYFSTGNQLTDFFDYLDFDWRNAQNSNFQLIKNLRAKLFSNPKE